jgi:hypothetical protein
MHYLPKKARKLVGWRLATGLLVAMLALAWSWPAAAQTPIGTDVVAFGARIPLGIAGFLLRPARRTLYVMSTARSRHFAGWRLVGEGPHRVVLAPDGSPVRLFPAHVEFRVTASARPSDFLGVDRDFLDWNGDLNQLLLDLGFRLKIFHGLQTTTLAPDSVEMLGMPADVPYDERIYRASFTLPQVPIEDRIVLEVLTPEQERLCKFHLEF